MREIEKFGENMRIFFFFFCETKLSCSQSNFWIYFFGFYAESLRYKRTELAE